jgi:hypothetical protein
MIVAFATAGHSGGGGGTLYADTDADNGVKENGWKVVEP